MLEAEDSPSVWGHYLAVAPTVSKPGCKEYWVECGTGVISLSKPDGTIENRGTPSDDLIETFSSYSDGRYIPKVSAIVEDGYAYFGEYPQTVVLDSTITSALADITPDSKGYRYYNGENYVSLKAKTYDTCSFDNGTAVVANNTYYFKVEPIKWRILSNSDSTLSLVADRVLDASVYDSTEDTVAKSRTARNNYNGTDETTSTESVFPSNYKYSDIRKFLNEDFFEKMNVPANSIITTTVNNSASTTEYKSNSFACTNTDDKVYLLSYKDYTNTNYFSNSTARRCTPTDYAKARSVQISSSGTYLGNAEYWTRSPDVESGFSSMFVHADGSLNATNTYRFTKGVRPGLRTSIA